jgi:hypothetical protein
MSIEIIGPNPFDLDQYGALKTRIGTAFPDYDVIYTESPAVHAWQRAAFIDVLNQRRSSRSLPTLSPEEEEKVAIRSVDLIVEPDHILIRPDPAHMDLAFGADELLQSIVSKRLIKFLSVADGRVREAIKRRGEFWRLGGVPKTREAKEKWIKGSRVGIQGLPIYFYNRLTGTRWLTCSAFESLGALPDEQLAFHLQEIADHAIRRNRRGRPELDFFAADVRRFGPAEFGGVLFAKLPGPELRAHFASLLGRFCSAVHGSFHKDDCRNKAWCERILSTLFIEGNEAQDEQVLSGLSSEFFLQVDWLPGGRFEEGEFLFDPVFDEAANRPGDGDLQRLGDSRAKGIILNFIRDYGDLEYINLGCVPESLSLDRPQDEGRRGVYLAEFKSRSSANPIRRFLRLQKWSVWEHLDEGKELLQAITESDDYTDYWLDRRLGCRQLGMNLSRRVFMRHLAEIYTGTNPKYRNAHIRTPYFEREYVAGIATDKLPPERYTRQGYATKFADLLGHTGASSLIVGRSYEFGKRTVFDDGDEVVREDEAGLPSEVLVCDHSGAFGEYHKPLEAYANDYARPVNIRAHLVPNPKEFALTYLESFRQQFVHIQSDYRKRRRAFDTLFKHCNYDTAGSFSYRWECVLQRLDHTDADNLLAEIASHIKVLAGPSPTSPPPREREKS